MKQLQIKKGERESEAFTLGHFQLVTVFVPEYSKASNFFLYGSPDGLNFGKVQDFAGEPIVYPLDLYYIQTLDPDWSTGLMYIKFVLPEPALETLTFGLYLLEGR